MEKIHVLVIDDSALMRLVISGLLSRDLEIKVVATAMNAKFALEKIDKLSPDIVTLDIEMPDIDGLAVLSMIKKKHPKLPVIMCSALTQNAAQATMKALNLGADDYVTKPNQSKSRDEVSQQFGKELIYKIKGLVKKRRSITLPAAQSSKTIFKINHSIERIDIVAIGTSTGGPKALIEVLLKIPADFPVPIVIVQHMPPIFTKILSESLDGKCSIRVIEAQDGSVLLPGQALIAPGNYHMTVANEHNRHVIRLNQEPQEHYCRPAVDVLFRSVARLFGQNALGVVMTGMGHDGLLGCQDIKEHRGQVIVQDEETSVVWGMPRAIAEAGFADQTLPLDDIGLAIVRRVNRKRVIL